MKTESKQQINYRGQHETDLKREINKFLLEHGYKLTLQDKETVIRAGDIIDQLGRV